jgi:hypothetical protein
VSCVFRKEDAYAPVDHGLGGLDLHNFIVMQPRGDFHKGDSTQTESEEQQCDNDEPFGYRRFRGQD